jgi:hypothetical protein
MPMNPDPKTREAERREAEKSAGADRAPTPEEERLAEEHSLDETVVEHEEEMLERGAKQKGEGRI